METPILSRIENDEIKVDVEAQLRAFRIFDTCPMCGFTGEVKDRGCKLVCGGCEIFVVASCSDF